MGGVKGLKELAKKAQKDGLLKTRGGYIKPRNESNNSLSYLAQFTPGASYDAQMGAFGDALFPTQEDTRFTGAMPRGKREKEYLNPFMSEHSPMDLREHQAQRQPWGHKLGRGLGRVGVEIGANILQMPGYVGGAVAAIGDKIAGGDESFDIFVNNWWVDAFEEAKDYYNNEAAPVYIKDAVQNGNLWANISSMDFWATEGASGLAFLISALAPGAAIQKFGTGLKLARALGKTGGKGLQLLEKSDEFAKTVGLANLENATNVLGATIGNTIYEAGVEADGGLKEYTESLQQKYINGEITRNQFLKLSAEAPNQAAKIFRDNLGILLLPNLMMSKALFGRAIPEKVLKTFEKTADGKIAPVVKSLTKLDRAKNFGQTLGKAFISEAAIEEGGQAVSTSYHTEDYLDSYLEGTEQKSVAETYFDMLKSTEGQKAMFLGTLFGSGAYAFGNYREKKARTKQQNKLAELMTTGVNFFESSINGIYKKDENGKLVMENGSPVVDHAKVAELGNNIDFINTLNTQRNILRFKADMGEEGAQEKADLLDRTILNNMLYSFTHAGEEGIAVLRNYLENSAGIDNLLTQQNANREVKQTKGQFVNEIVNEAQSLRQDLEYYGKYGNFKNKLIENAKDNPYYEKYSQLIQNKYAAVKSNLRYLDKALAETNTAMEKAKSELSVTADSLREEAKSNYSSMTVKELKEIAAEKGLTLNSKMRKAEIVDAITDASEYQDQANDMVTSLESKIKSIKELIADNKSELKGITDVSKQKKAYTKFKKAEIKKEQAQKEAEELDDLLNQIRGKKTAEEIDAVEIPTKFKTGNAQKAIAKVKRETKDGIKSQTQQAKDAQKESVSDEVQKEKDRKAEAKKKLDFIKNTYQKGEQVPTEGLEGVPEGFDIFDSASEDGVTLKNEKGETYTVDYTEVYKIAYDPDNQYSTEDTGTPVEYSPKENIDSQVYLEENKDARIAITDNKKEGAVKILFPDLQAAYQWEVTPGDKRGYYGIELNEEVLKHVTSEGAKALGRYLDEGVTADNIDYLVDHLPLNIKLTDTIGAPLENKTKNEKYNEIFRDTTAKLKRTILKELQNGTPIESIEIEIKGQYGGRIQTETQDNGLPAENNVKDLYYFNGDISNIKSSDVYIVNDIGQLENAEGRKVDLRRELAAGEVYIMIQTANGTEFPLKLNVKKIDAQTADFLYELYKIRFAEYQGKKLPKDAKGKGALLKDHPGILKRFKEEFPEVWKIFDNQDIDEGDLTIKDITDFFIFDNTSNLKSRVLFDRGQLKIGTNVFTQEEFLDNKDGFIAALTDVKRQHVRFKKHKKHRANISLSNRDYLEYVFDNKVLNTNASTAKEVFEGDNTVVADPIFKDRTTMYMSTNTVKVNGELSQFNEVKQAVYAPELFGSNKALKKVLPKFFDLEITLSKDGQSYTDKHGNVYKRVTSLVPFTGEPMPEANTRGNVVDLLLRDFFDPMQEVNNLNRFTAQGLEYLEKQNAIQETDVAMDAGFFESLFDTFIEYANMFQEQNLTVYSNVPSVMFKMGGEQYAGTVDLVVHNNKTGTWGIIDLKTSREDRQLAYEKNDKYNYKGKDLKQQNAYREAFRQTVGLEIDTLQIMPLRVNPSSKENYIGSVVNTSAKKLLDVSTEKNIFEILNKTENAPKIDVDEYKEIAGAEELAEVENDPDLDDYSDFLEYADGLPTNQMAEETPAKKEEPKTNTASAKHQQQMFLKAKSQVDKGEFTDVKLTIGGEVKEFIVTFPIVKDKKVKGGLIVLNKSQIGKDKSKVLVTDINLYNKVIAEYNSFVDESAKMGYRYVKVGPVGIVDAFNIITDFNQPKPVNKGQRVVKTVKKVAPKVEEAPKKQPPKVEPKKVEEVKKKADDFLSKVTEENHKQILKTLRSKGYINSSNLKAVGEINARLKGPAMVREVIKHLIKQGTDQAEIVKNCIV